MQAVSPSSSRLSLSGAMSTNGMMGSGEGESVPSGSTEAEQPRAEGSGFSWAEKKADKAKKWSRMQAVLGVSSVKVKGNRATTLLPKFSSIRSGAFEAETSSDGNGLVRRRSSSVDAVLRPTLIIPQDMPSIRATLPNSLSPINYWNTAQKLPASLPHSPAHSQEDAIGIPDLTGLDDSTQPKVSPEGYSTKEPQLSAIVWKRRSRFGKLSYHAWERRRIKLQGTKLSYYKTTKEILQAGKTLALDQDGGGDNTATTSSIAKLSAAQVRDTGDHDAADDEDNDHDNSSYNPHSFPMINYMYNKATTKMKTAKHNIKYAASYAHAYYEPSDPNAPRGVLDVRKTGISVAASSGDSYAPTPYGIILRYKSETKWKFCFETQNQQMEWLGALTGIIVAKSVNVFHSKIDRVPTDETFEIQAGHSPQSNNPTSANCDEAGAADLSSPDELVDSGNISDDVSPPTLSRGVSSAADPSSDRFRSNPSIHTQGALLAIFPPSNTIWILSQNKLFFLLTFVNVALLYSRVSSTETNGFWTVLVLINVCFWAFLEPKRTGVESAKKNTDSFSFSRMNRKMEVSSSIHHPNKNKPQAIPSSTQSENEVRCFNNDGEAIEKSMSDIEDGDEILEQISTEEEFDGDEDEGKCDGVAQTSVAQKANLDFSYKPLAGMTTICVEHPSDSAVRNGNRFGAWRSVPGNLFEIRSRGYLSTKKKIPSPSELYDLINVDIFESQRRYPDIAGRVVLPKVSFKDDTPKTWKSPDIFVVSFCLPTQPPRLGRSTTDGQGYTVTMYYVMKEETRAILRKVTKPGYNHEADSAKENSPILNGVRLFEEWCRRSPSDSKFQGRFKVVPLGQNLKEIGLPSWIARYNGKPFLIKRSGQTGFLYDHPELNAMQFDISMHCFPYLFKQGAAFAKEYYFKKVLFSIAFVIEGRDDQELPEVVIGNGAQICYPDPSIAIQAEDLFSGTSIRSFEVDEEGNSTD